MEILSRTREISPPRIEVTRAPRLLIDWRSFFFFFLIATTHFEQNHGQKKIVNFNNARNSRIVRTRFVGEMERELHFFSFFFYVRFTRVISLIESLSFNRVKYIKVKYMHTYIRTNKMNTQSVPFNIATLFSLRMSVTFIKTAYSAN